MKFYTKPVQEGRSRSSLSVDNCIFLSRYGEAKTECVNY